MATSGTGIFQNDDALDFVGQLQKAAPTAVGDLISSAIRSVAQAEAPVTSHDVDVALAAAALVLSEFDDDLLADAPDAAALKAWFIDLEIELNPARRQITLGAINRILLPQDNEWFDLRSESGDSAAALATVERLRDVLADSAADE
jgi:hypothetical protein